MAKKKKGKKRKYKRNPAALTRARSAFGGLSFKTALKNVWAFQVGMLAAKAASKRGNEEYPATETDPESWVWSNYAKGGAGTVAAAVIGNMLKPGSGQKILEGGLNLMVYKLIQNELVPKSEWATNNLGQLGQAEQTVMIDEATGAPIMMGQGGPIPLDESHRMQEYLEPQEGYDGYDGMDGGDYGDLGESLVSPGRLGGALVPPGRLGADPYARYYAAYRQ